MPVDLFSLVQDGKRSVSFMSQALGLMADLDLGTEHLRWMGDARFGKRFFPLPSHCASEILFPFNFSSALCFWIEHQSSGKCAYLRISTLLSSPTDVPSLTDAHPQSTASSAACSRRNPARSSCTISPRRPTARRCTRHSRTGT